MTSAREAERRLVLSYAAPATREPLAALLAFDDALANVLQTTREPMVGHMRLTWWHGAISALSTCPVAGEPVLAALGREVVPRTGAQRLLAIVEGWEELVDADPDDDALRRYADARGGALFAVGGGLLGAAPGDPLAAGGRAWALADLARHSRDAALGARAAALAAPAIAGARSARWSRAGRPLGAMMHLAAGAGRGPLARVGRALVHRLTGR